MTSSAPNGGNLRSRASASRCCIIWIAKYRLSVEVYSRVSTVPSEGRGATQTSRMDADIINSSPVSAQQRANGGVFLLQAAGDAIQRCRPPHVKGHGAPRAAEEQS